MSVVHPGRLHVGDIVLMECFVVRTAKADRWTLAFHPYAFSLLARAPPDDKSDGVAFTLPPGPDVVFPGSL